MTIINTNSISGINSITAQGSSGIEFYESSGVNERLRITSGGRLGIGTASPRDPVHIFHPTNNVNLLIESGDANAYLAFRDNDTTSDTAVYLGAEGNNLKFITSGDERLRINNTGALGLGVISPKDNSGNYRQLQIGLGAHFYGRTDDTQMYIVSNGYRDGSNWKYTANTTASQIALGTNIVFETAGAGSSGNNISFSEKLRITSGGQLQATGASDVRLTLGSGGTAGTNDSVHVRADGANLLFMNASGGLTKFERNGSETLTLTSGGDVSVPNGNITMGAGRGINFHNYGSGATISTNLLDDYEEGTWTPVFSNGGTLSINGAHYTKVGRLVNAYMYIASISSIPNNTNQFLISGLPYNALDGQHYPAGVIGYSVGYDVSPWVPLVANNNSYIYFHRMDGNQNIATNASFTGVPALLITITYFTS